MKLLLISIITFITVSFLDNNPSFAAKKGLDLNTAQSAYAQKNYEKVISLLSPHIEKLDRKGLLLLGKAYGEVGNSSLAVKSYTAVLAMNPKDAEAKTNIGAEFFKTKKDKEAIAALKEALDFNPTFIPAYRTLIKIYEKRDNKYELRILYQDMVEKIGETQEFLTKLCELTTRDSLYDLAFKYCTRGTELFFKEPRNHVYLGLAYRDTGKTEEANKVLKNTAEAFPKSEFAQITYAQFLIEKKNYIGSYGYFKKALTANPESILALVGLGASALEIQKYEESLAAFQKACLKDKTKLPDFKRAANVLRTSKVTAWIKKFEIGIEKCGG